MIHPLDLRHHQLGQMTVTAPMSKLPQALTHKRKKAYLREAQDFISLQLVSNTGAAATCVV